MSFNHSKHVMEGNVSYKMTVRQLPRSRDSLKSLSVIYHICQRRLEMIIEGDPNLRTLQFSGHWFFQRGKIFLSLLQMRENMCLCQWEKRAWVCMRKKKECNGCDSIMACATGSIRIRSSICVFAGSPALFHFTFFFLTSTTTFFNLATHQSFSIHSSSPTFPPYPLYYPA